MEGVIVSAVCLVLAAIGIPSALNQGSILGWILSIIGVGGISALFIFSIWSRRGIRPTFDDFLAGIFFFFVSLGFSGGIFLGNVYHSLWLGACAGAAGLFAGYVLGIFAGLWMQYLGWMAIIINMLAGLAAIVVIGTAVIMLCIV